MSQLRAQARNDIRSCQKSTAMHHSGMPKLNSFKAPDMLFPSANLYTSEADQSFYINGHRIKIAASTSGGSADFVKGPRLSREMYDPRMFDHKSLKMHTNPSSEQRDDCAPSTHRKRVPARALSTKSSSQSPSRNNIPVLDTKSVTALLPPTTRHSSQLSNQKKASVAPLYVSKSGKADDNTLTSSLINSVHDKKDNKFPLYVLPNSDVSDYGTLRKLTEPEAATESRLSFAEAVDFEYIGNLLLKDIWRVNETRIDPTGVTSQTSQGNSCTAFPTLGNDDVRGEVVSNSSTTRPSVAENVNHKVRKRHVSKGSLDTRTITVVPPITPGTSKHFSPRSSYASMITLPPIGGSGHATVTTFPPLGGSTSMRDGVHPDMVSSISSTYDPTQPPVPELSSRKDPRLVIQNGVDSLQNTSIKNKEKEECIHPMVLHPLEVFREFNIPKEMYDICFQPNTDKRYDRWKRTERNDKRRRTSSTHSSDEEDQESVAAFHNLILSRQQKVVEDAGSRMRISTNSGTDSCKSQPSPKSTKTPHRKKAGCSSTASRVKPIRREAHEHPGFSFEDAVDVKPIPYKDNTILPTLHKTPNKVTPLDKRNTHALPVSPEKLDHKVTTKLDVRNTPEELELYGSHPVTSSEGPEYLHNFLAIKSLPTNTTVRDTSVKMSRSTGDKTTSAMMGSDFQKGNTVGPNIKKTRGNATLKSKCGRITESGSHMENYPVLAQMSNVQVSPGVGPLTSAIYNPGLTSAFTFSMFELPREHKDNNVTMKKKASILRKKPKKNKC